MSLLFQTLWQVVTRAEEIETNCLLNNYIRPVRWEESIRAMIGLRCDTFIECGPGKVLCGLVKKIDRSAVIYCVYDEAVNRSK